MSAIDSQAILSVIVSHALASGRFERVNEHEPTSAPGHGLTAAAWFDEIEGVPSDSGLAATTARLVFQVRVYGSAMAEPKDDIDPRLVAAVDDLLTRYSADFDLGGTVRNIDLLGQSGAKLRGKAGYLALNQQVYRVFTITLPVLVNDAWPQSP